MLLKRPYTNNLFVVFLILTLLIGSAAFPTSVQAATLTVTNTNDSDAGSLRDTIVGAASGDTITFDSSLSGGTIHVASTLDLLKDVTIDGSDLATPITISGGGSARVFIVDFGVTAMLDSLIVAQGSAGDGGGIWNDGALTITNSLFFDNSAGNVGGAISNNATGTLTITDSTFSGGSAHNGGAIGNFNQLTITNSTFFGNTSNDVGGALYNVNDVDGHNMLTITNSTFSGNTATFGGGLFSEQPIIIRNSTFSENSGIGGGATGAGIWQEVEQLNYANTIIANSLVGGDCMAQSGVGTNTNNLVEDGSCASPLNVDPNLDPLSDNGGLTHTFALLANSPAIDAGDDTVCDDNPGPNNLDQRGNARPNGGHCDIGAYEYVDTTAPSVTVFSVPASPTTLNIPITTFTASDDAVITGYLITESATLPTLVNPGWTASPPTTYPVASMGSYTLYPWAKDAAGHVSALYGSPASVNITCLTSITVTSSANSGPGTLRQALADACVGDLNNISMIDFDSALSGSTIHLASELTISKNVTIDGSDLASPITISGDSDNNGTGDVRVFSITGGSPGLTVKLDTLIVTKGATSGHGAGLFMEQGMHVTIQKSTFSDNHAGGRGGGIGNQGVLTLIDSTVSGNSAAETGGGGGGISNESGITITNSTISNNSATGAAASGGGLGNFGGATITNSTIFGNSSSAYGGGISTTANLTITNSTITGNSAGIVGGLMVEGNITHLRNTIIANNSSTTINSFSHNDCSDTSDYPNPPTPDGDGIMTNINNLIEDGSCSPLKSGDPKLGALADNGGPTKTMALLPGSFAINAGDDATCTSSPVSSLDQRGVTRPWGSHCDIGAFELEATLADVQVDLAGSNVGNYDILFGESTFDRYGINGGPLHVTSTNGLPIFTSQRAIFGNSFNSIVGYPGDQLTTDYWFTSYDDIGMITYLVIGNPHPTDTALVDVYIGGVKRNITPYSIAPGQRIFPRYGINGGPVHVVSTNSVPIFTSERTKFGNSFSEVMGYPGDQLTTEYWFTSYDDVGMTTYLVIGNPHPSQTAQVDVYIAGVKKNNTPYQIAPGQRIFPRYGINGGPVRVISINAVDIFSSERTKYGNTFNEVTGYPGNQVDTEFWFTSYDDTSMITYLVVGNPDSALTAEVDVYIGDVKKNATSYSIAPGQRIFHRYSVNNGPVRVVSTNGVDIFASARSKYLNSFNEILGIAYNQLTTDYWFTSYDDLGMDTFLVISTP